MLTLACLLRRRFDDKLDVVLFTELKESSPHQKVFVLTSLHRWFDSRFQMSVYIEVFEKLAH